MKSYKEDAEDSSLRSNIKQKMTHLTHFIRVGVLMLFLSRSKLGTNFKILFLKSKSDRTGSFKGTIVQKLTFHSKPRNIVENLNKLGKWPDEK